MHHELVLEQGPVLDEMFNHRLDGFNVPMHGVRVQPSLEGDER